MTTGFDDIGWASMTHAYGDASDVPRLLRGLASADPAQRDIALDGMYGAVHHQGDVYDSTVACLPFLFALVADASVADRGALVELLCSVAGEDEPDPEELADLFADEEDGTDRVAHILAASALVRGRAEFFLERLGDPDPGLREALPRALVQLHGDPARVLAALRERLTVERTDEVVRALVRAIGLLGARHAQPLGAAAGACLRAVVESASAGPELRVTALAQLARCAPALLPEDSVAIATEVMQIAYETASEPGEAPASVDRPRTKTLVSHLRDIEAAHRASIDTNTADALLEELQDALGDRTAERFALVNDQLCGAHRGQRMAAVRLSGRLLTGWRAPDDRTVVLLGCQLAEHDERLSRATLSKLAQVYPIAHAAADMLTAALVEWQDQWDPESWESSLFGKALDVLASQGDARAMPHLTTVLESGSGVPEHLFRWVGAMGSAATPLAPVLHRRLAADGADAARSGSTRLVAVLSRLRHTDSLPLVTRVLHEHHGAQTQSPVLRAVGRFGRAAADIAPYLRELVSDSSLSSSHRMEAADALWAVTGESEPALPLLSQALAATQPYHRNLALRITRSLGPRAATLAPRLRELSADEGSLEATLALWKVRTEAAEVLPTLLAQWSANPATRPETAACLAEMGSDARPALPLIHEELAATRRHNNRGSRSNMRHACADDEALLSHCRRIAAGPAS